VFAKKKEPYINCMQPSESNGRQHQFGPQLGQGDRPAQTASSIHSEVLIVYRLRHVIPPFPDFDRHCPCGQFMGKRGPRVRGMVFHVHRRALLAYGIFGFGYMTLIISARSSFSHELRWSPRLKQLKKEGEQERKKDQPIHTLSAPVAWRQLQAYALRLIARSCVSPPDPGQYFRMRAVITLVRGDHVPDVAGRGRSQHAASATVSH